LAYAQLEIRFVVALLETSSEQLGMSEYAHEKVLCAAAVNSLHKESLMKMQATLGRPILIAITSLTDDIFGAEAVRLVIVP